MTKSESNVLVSCIGVDDKQHVCTPDSNICKCGVAVWRKKLLKNDHLLFSCYECTF